MSRLLRALILGAVVWMFVSSSTASAATQWEVKARWGDTVIAPGDTAQFVIVVHNIGTSASTGLVTLKDRFPAGMRIDHFEPTKAWVCSGAGTSTATCIEEQPIQALDNAETSTYLSYADRIMVNATCIVAAGCSAGTRPNIVQVTSPGAIKADGTPCGGGSPPIPCVTETDPITFGSGGTLFGVTPGTFVGDVFNAYPGEGTERQAGTHPRELRVDFDLNLTHGLGPLQQLGEARQTFTMPVGRIRTVEVTLPRGLFGNPEALPKCSPADFLSEGSTLIGEGSTTGCPPDTQLGTAAFDVNDGQENNGFGIFGNPGNNSRVAIYNLQPPRGVPADFGFTVAGLVTAHIYPSLDPAQGYAIKTTSPGITDILPVRGVQVTIWGVPGDPVHDVYRAYSKLQPNGDSFGAPPPASVRPFLTMPMDCGFNNGPFSLRTDDWRNPGVFTPILEAAETVNVTGCEDPRIRFEPEVSLQPTSRAAGGPTGLDVHLKVPQREQLVDEASKLYAENGNVHGIDTPPMKKAVVTLPEGMTLSSSAVQGLGFCTLEQIGIEPDGKPNDNPVHCPENSRYGALILHTPILPSDEPMVGDIYIAKQGENPFHNFLAMYFVIHDENRGLLLKLPGKIELDPVTGQIKTTFDELPQFPVSDMQLTFKSGVRAALVNSQTCGEKRIKVEFFSWADPNTPITRESAYDITEKPNGSPCVQSLAERPFGPVLSAGTISNSAASFSPFVFRLTRTDEDQEFSQLKVVLPPGVLAKLAGVSQCPDAGIAQAEERTGAGGGHLEETSPSCPASSQIGTIEVGTGVGQALTYIPGKIYLAGPYKGAPISMAVITPILAGPYDLGVFAVRTALEIDHETAQVTATTDLFPQIYQGIPVRIRDISVRIDRREFIINPTNCNSMQITGSELAIEGATAAVSSPFQAANCALLGFKPKFTASTSGNTSRKNGASLHVRLTYPDASAGLQANIKSVRVELPIQLPSRLSTLQKACTDTVFNANPATCPAGSRVGTAKAVTPILPVPLEGPAYFVSHGGAKFPELIIVLQGYGVTLDLHGETFISKKGITSSIFRSVPDAPVTSFELTLPQGADSALAANQNLCYRTVVKKKRNVKQRVKLVMPTVFTAQNGALIRQSTVVSVSGCRSIGRVKHRKHPA